MANRGVSTPSLKDFSSKCGELLFQPNFMFVGTLLMHLSMKSIFQIGPTDFALNLDKGKGAGTPLPWSLSKN